MATLHTPDKHQPHRNRASQVLNRIRTDKSLGLFCIFWLILGIQFSAFQFLCGLNTYSALTNICMSFIDALIFLSPYLLIKRTWRWSVVFPMVLLPVFLYINLLYYRNVGELVAISGFFQVGNANDLVVRSALATVKVIDLFIWLPLMLFIALYIGCFKSIMRGGYSLRFKLLSLAGVIILFLLQMFQMQRIWYHENSRLDHFSWTRYKEMWRNDFPRDVRTRKLALTSFPVYIADELYAQFKPAYKLSAEERAMLDELVSRRSEAPLLIDSLPDNSGKNLLYIVMESLNSKVLETKVNGRPVMPVLDSLCTLDGTILFTGMQPKVGLGRSSDAAMMYLTGLLPDLQNPVVEKFPDAEYPSVARLPQFKSAAKYLPSSSKVWNHVRVTRSQGFTEFFGDLAVDRAPLANGDSIGIAFMLQSLPKLKQPFFAAFFTIDGHDPYTVADGHPTDISQSSDFSDTEKIYLEKNRNTDFALGMLVEGLKREHLWDNTIVVIVSDHNALERSLASERFDSDKRIPMLILNSGISLRTNRQVAQIDLYPTILDIMGADNYYWHGFGTSMLRNRRYFDNDNAEEDALPANYPGTGAWNNSKLMFKGGYFKSKAETKQ